MARITQESLEKLNLFIDSLPAEARSKCALCNETLTHIVKTAEVETGAGTATVTRALAEKINQTAAPGDRVSGEQLRGRVRDREGTLKRYNVPNKPGPDEKPETPDHADLVEEPPPPKKPTPPSKHTRESVGYSLRNGFDLMVKGIKAERNRWAAAPERLEALRAHLRFVNDLVDFHVSLKMRGTR